uniref:Uncharacterized protein n=1 Tax=Rhizophora mucronata TaxID=61149 RepID=A0A2P2Q2L4_RHIMU
MGIFSVRLRAFYYSYTTHITFRTSP